MLYRLTKRRASFVNLSRKFFVARGKLKVLRSTTLSTTLATTARRANSWQSSTRTCSFLDCREPEACTTSAALHPLHGARSGCAAETVSGKRLIRSRSDDWERASSPSSNTYASLKTYYKSPCTSLSGPLRTRKIVSFPLAILSKQSTAFAKLRRFTRKTFQS